MKLSPGDALLVADVQDDFLPGGSLGIPGGDKIVEPLNRCLSAFAGRGLPTFASRDWHPPDHCSFKERGGPWPAHCVQGSRGARFAAALRLPAEVAIISKATDPKREAYSAFDGTGLEARLRALGVRRLVIGGLATDYCVLASARDALALGFSVAVLVDGVQAIDEAAGRRALAEVQGLGAELISSSAVSGAAA